MRKYIPFHDPRVSPAITEAGRRALAELLGEIEPDDNTPYVASNVASAVMWQQVAAMSYMLAQFHLRNGRLQHAAYYQEAAARDHKHMTVYLQKAI